MKAVLLQAVVTILCSSPSQTRDPFDGRLILTPFVRNGSASIARCLSEVTFVDFQDVTSHSGFLTVKEEYNSNMFFWFFPAEKLADTPWIIWLQGGPGTTSLFGLFQLIGPWKVEDDKATLRNVTWTGDYSVLFLDNPVGAGFSFTEDDRGYTDNEDDVGGQMFEFIQQFVEIFPELREAPLFIAGESYAGKYVPALAIQIHRHRHKVPINLRGLLIGNGMIDPRSMMHYSELCGALGLVDEDHMHILRTMETDMLRLVDDQKMVEAARKFLETIAFIKKMSGVSIFNFNSDPDKEGEFQAYVVRPDVRQSIHVGNGSFHYNNKYVDEKMLPDYMNTTKPFVEELLEHYGVMSYSGQLDIILSYSMSKNTYKELRWSGREKYRRAPRKHLRRSTDAAVVAYKKSGGNFTEVLIRRAGHMVPKDQPEVAKFLIDLFINEYK